MQKRDTEKNKSKTEEIPKAYDSNAEMEMYELWEQSGAFNPDNAKTGQKPFVMTLPPPNANDKLHVGHVCGYSFEDTMGRYNRMKGRPTLLLPGKDHAGIQTEAVFTRVLREKGIDKWKMGREEFYRQCYDYCIENSKHARAQERRIGLSADWSREKFTLDPKLTEVIYETFYKMLEEKLIYRGKYIVNQCVYCRTALANVDTEHKEKSGIFAYIRYPLADKSGGRTDKSGKHVTVATTRPETMLGDTAVAVNPKDKRYKDLIGKQVELPLTGRTIPVIADREVDETVGTGALKVTPAHSAIDFKIGLRHKLAVVNVIGADGKMTDEAPEKYRGMNVIECREAVLEDLKAGGYLEKVEEIMHEVLVCERCGHDIEQIISNQWFADVKDLAGRAKKALDDKKIRIYPHSQERVLSGWFKNIEPWCISRQLWWGHRIPVWYCGSKALYDWLQDNPGKTAKDYEEVTGKKANGCGIVIPGANTPKKCPKCAGARLEPEQDVFDTWFSSGQWPFSTLGGPGAPDYETYYPTDVMENARDILFFWDAREIMLGLYRTNTLPFHTIYLHGWILAADGTKMSKSRGNGVPPEELFEKYGSDAVRLWFYTDTLPGQNTPIREEKLKGTRNFVNKIWNASRYVMMQTADLPEADRADLSGKIAHYLEKFESSDDDWIVELRNTAQTITKHIDTFRFNLAVEEVREYFWHVFCDKRIEETKQLLQEKPADRIDYLARLIAMLAMQMKLIHPFAPFVTERVWQTLRSYGLLVHEDELLMTARWPVPSTYSKKEAKQ